jgi:hypothetical protein
VHAFQCCFDGGLIILNRSLQESLETTFQQHKKKHKKLSRKEKLQSVSDSLSSCPRAAYQPTSTEAT